LRYEADVRDANQLKLIYYGRSIAVSGSGINGKINLSFGSGPQSAADQAGKRLRRNGVIAKIKFSIPGDGYSHGVFPKGVGCGAACKIFGPSTHQRQ
jgi:hypothetical protein